MTTGSDRARALSDTGYLARNYLGFNYDKCHKTGQKINVGSGGVRASGPHKEMTDLLDGPSLWKHLEAPRDSYKTTCLQSFVIRKICGNPNIRVLWFSATDDEAEKYVGAIYDQLTFNERLIEEFGPFEPKKGTKGRLWTKQAFTIAGRTDRGLKDPTVTSAAVNTNFTGGHFDLIVVDDIVNFQNTATDTMLQKVMQVWKMVLPLLDPGGILVLNGTRYHDDDLSGHVLTHMRKDFECVILDCGMFPMKHDDGTLFLEGRPVFDHLTVDYLEKRLRGMGMRDFNSQYNNQISGVGVALFSRRQFIRMRTEPWMKGMRAYVITDTATTADEEGCLSVAGVVGLDGQEIAYLFDLRCGHWLPDQVVNEIVAIHQRWSAYLEMGGICMEKGALNKIFRFNIEKEARSRGLALHFIEMPRGRDEGSKLQRIQGLSARFQRREFLVMDTVPNTFEDLGKVDTLFDPEGWREPATGEMLPDGELVRQFIRFPVYGKRDIADAVADIDMLDKNGRRLCPGGVGRALPNGAPFKGAYIQQRINGKLQPVAVTPMGGKGQSQDSLWSRLAQRVPKHRRRT